MADIISWIATAATVLAASITAANLGSRITGYGFVIFTVGAFCWIAVGVTSHQPALMWTNIALAILDMFGIWRWLGRQAEVEEGASKASAESEGAPGEALFPVSLLTSAIVRTGEAELGRCVDAMAGCGSGRISYVVVSHGGVAGVGEQLRRLPWDRAKVEGETLVTAISPDEFGSLEILPRDRWPAR